MTVLLTGAAGFIGFHTVLALLAAGERVIGADNVNDYYDISLKEARLDKLANSEGEYTFYRVDVADARAIDDLVAAHPNITHVVHLAAQAGVRYSLENPRAYTRANVEGQLVLLEACRRLAQLAQRPRATSRLAAAKLCITGLKPLLRPPR